MCSSSVLSLYMLRTRERGKCRAASMSVDTRVHTTIIIRLDRIRLQTFCNNRAWINSPGGESRLTETLNHSL